MDVHAAVAAEGRSLAGDVAGRGEAGGDEPLGERGVQAASDGVFGDARVAGEEGADLEGDFAGRHAGRARGSRLLAAAVRADQADLAVRPDDADVEPGQDGAVGADGEHLLGRAEHDAAPVGAVVAPGVVEDVVARNAQAAGNEL